MSRKRWVGVACLALAAALSVGCSGPKLSEPVELGSLPASVGAPIPLDGKVGQSGAFAVWPDACDLLTDQVIESLLPQAESISREPEPRTFTFHSADDPLAGRGTKVEIANSRCTTTFTIPVGLLEADVTRPSFLVLLDYAGSPAGFKLNYEYDEAKAVPVEGGTCMRDDVMPHAYACANATGQVAFTVAFDLPHHGKSLKDPTRYTHDGETVTFTSSADDAKRREYLDEHVTIPAIEAILTRLKG